MILDASPLVAAARDERRFWALYKAARHRGTPLVTTEAVVAQVYRDPRQVSLIRAIKGMDVVGFGEGRTVGRVCGVAGTSDVVDASLAVLASLRHEPVLTADVDDFERLADAVEGLDIRRF